MSYLELHILLYKLLDILREIVREETQGLGIIKHPCYLSQSLWEVPLSAGL